MITSTNSIKSILFLALVVTGLTACGGGGGGSGGPTNDNPGGFTSSTPNTKPQTSSSIVSSLAASSTPSSISSSSRRSAAGADLSAPTIPENFEVGLKVYDAIGLNWNFSTDNIGVVSYKIYRDNVQIGDAGEVDSAFLDFDVAPDKTYNYSIAAVDAVGNASPLNTVTVRTPPAPIYTGSSISSNSSSRLSSSVSSISTSASTSKSSTQSSAPSSQTSSKSSTGSSAGSDLTPPEAPISLTATATLSTKVDLEWSAATDNQAVAAYRIYRDNVQQATVKASVLSFSDVNVIPNKTYVYAVETVDLAGNSSVTRKTLMVTTPSAATNGDVTLYWAAPTQREDDSSLSTTELGGYVIRYKSAIGNEFTSIYIPNALTGSYIVPNLVGEYEFQIAAYDKNNLHSKFVSLTPH